MFPKVSVIIPTYNRADLLPRAIRSVLNQTFQDFELIIVDDCSTDNTQEVVNEFQKKDDRIKYIKLDKNSGAPAHPKNVGIQKSKGEYLAFLDHDDEWLPVKLEKQLKLFARNRKLGFVSCNVFIVNDKQSKEREHKIPRSANYFLSFLEGDIICSSSSVMVKKSVLNDIGYFDERFKVIDDWDMWIRISQKYAFDFVDEPLLKYYIHSSSVTKTISFEGTAMDIQHMIDKYKDYYRNNPKIYNVRIRKIGTIYLLDGDVEKAREYFLRSIKIRPFYLRTYLNLIASLFGPNFYKKLLFYKEKMASKLNKL